MKLLKNFLLSITIILFFTCGCTKKQNADTITFSTWGSHSEIQIITPLIKEFENQNNIKVKLIHIPQNYFQKLHLLFASNQAPDVIFINNYYLPIYVKANLLENLEIYKTDKNLYFKNAINALSINNNLYGIPRDISNLVVYYNKDIFKKKNIPLPSQNWTYNEFLQVAQQLTDNDTYGIGFEEHPLFWEPIVWANGGEIFDENGALKISERESLSALKFYIELRTLHKVAPTKLNCANMTMAQMFLNEKIAMQISGRWLVPKYRSEAKFDWDVISLPNGKYGSIAGSDTSGWAISKNAKNKKLAFKFIEYLSSYDSINKMSQSGLITPARLDCAHSASFLDNQKPKNAKIFLEINGNAKLTNIPRNYNIKIEKLIKKLEPYFLGKEKINHNTKFEL